MAASAPKNSANFFSKVSWSERLPFKKREPVQPVPQYLTAFDRGFLQTRGSWSEAQIIIRAHHDQIFAVGANIVADGTF